MSIDISEPKKRTDSSSYGKSLSFVNYIINRCRSDKGIRAALKRADNPATEYQSWEVLAAFHINLEREDQRMPYTAIAAAIARAQIEKNGSVKIGDAITRCYETGNSSDQGKAKLRRLLACDSVPEVCRILRPLFSLIESKSGTVLDYASLLNDLLRFSHDDSRLSIKARWAQDFYGKPIGGGGDEQ